MTEIGKVYANTEREEDRANQIFIEMGAIAGDGLLGIVVEAIDELHDASMDYGRYAGSSSSEGVAAIERMESAWLEVFAALKAIEEAQ